jgi:hypothetical protein
MTAKRRILDRPRKPAFVAETLVLFVELERTPVSGRRSVAFQDRESELARLLGLEMELICDCRSVLERGPPPPVSFNRPVTAGQRRVYQTRLDLLGAVAAKTGRAP